MTALRVTMAALCLVVTAAAVATAQSGQAGAEEPYAPPRTADGQPDLQGIWQALNTAAWDIQDHSARAGVPAGQGVVVGNEIPYQEWALAQKQENFENRLTADPETQCNMPGVPRITYMPYPFQILQFSDRILILYEYVHVTRTIYMDGSPHPEGHIDFWMGDSRGRWEGDTLVVDVIHFNDRTWFDRAGNFHSDALAARRRALHADRAGSPPVRGDHRGPEGLHPALDDAHAALPPSGGRYSAPGIRVLRVLGERAGRRQVMRRAASSTGRLSQGTVEGPSGPRRVRPTGRLLSCNDADTIGASACIRRRRARRSLGATFARTTFARTRRHR